ncbi:YfbU family protein [Pseudovibrio ascidiaceicola]|uniref:YfbU family protein n=1 Tax=Pseudovibrio ascidiaceicola TaxID=285279 RepID=UPI001356DCFB|nr:YfbU family protein [Pseudovibrio ascidiaceicola]
MQFSDGERLIVAMLCDMYKQLEIKGDFDPELIQAAICGGNTWLLKNKYQYVFNDYEAQEEHIAEVRGILDMWWFIETAYQKLSDAENEQLKEEFAPFSGKFLGFDGNNESEHYSIAQVLINDLGHWSDIFAGRDLNSHAPLLPYYKRMLAAFTSIRGSNNRGGLGKEGIRRILAATVQQES